MDKKKYLLAALAGIFLLIFTLKFGGDYGNMLFYGVHNLTKNTAHSPDVRIKELVQSNCEIRAMKYDEMGYGGARIMPADSYRQNLPGIAATESVINLVLDYTPVDGRKNYYNADFAGEFILKNPYNEKAYIQFYMPLPGDGGVISNLRLLVDGVEPPDVTYTINNITWSGLFLPDEAKKLNVTYNALGMGRYTYALPKGERMKKLCFDLKVKGTKKVEVPEGCLPPVSKSKDADGMAYTWSLENLVTNMDIGVQLPAGTQLANFGKLFGYAPALCLIFLGGLIGGSALFGMKARTLPVILTTAAYAFFYPVSAYLSAYMDISYALPVSIIVIAGFVLIYLWKVVSTRFAVSVGGVCLMLLLGVPSLALLFPEYAGIIVTALALSILGIIMAATAKSAKMSVVKPEASYCH
ncbi:MAG: hypothetical protein M1269_01925 [Chloroflexi bacterium]|nr:hypothetical protein [Chloroflexota bacterium]